MRDVEATTVCPPFSSTSQRIHPPCHGRDTTTMESIQAHQVKGTLSQLQTLERCSSQPKTTGPWSAVKN